MVNNKNPIRKIGGGRVGMKATVKANEILGELALKLYKRGKGKSANIGLTKPSRSLAIDYLIVVAAKNGELDASVKLNKDNNLWLALGEEE